MPNLLANWNMHTCVCVIGVGFVGESLLHGFSKAYDSIGFDISDDRIKKLEHSFKSSSRVRLTSNPNDLGVATHFFIAVPTLLRSDNSVDLGCVVSAIETVLSVAKQGTTIVIESTVPVGTTRRLLGDHQYAFHCGMSPERIDPGRVSPSPTEIPKLVSGLTLSALKKIASIYSAVYQDIKTVSTPEVAEMAKLYENSYRMVNIAYVNEISDACRSHGIDPYEMIEAAATKPFGFQPFYPGVGVGGHCIPVSPHYLISNNKHLPILEHATSIMEKRPRKLARRFHRHVMCRMSKRLDIGSRSMPRILLVGLGFKSGQADISGSPAITFAQTLREMGCDRLAFHDPLVTKQPFQWLEKIPQSYWNVSYIDCQFDGVYICVAQGKVDLALSKDLRSAYVSTYVHL